MKRIKISTLVVITSLALYGGQAAAVGCTAIAGNQASPFLASQPNPNNGFAEFVTDSNGVALEICLDPANCFSDPVIAGNLFSEQIGFGAEAFWWLADASIDTSTGLSALVVLAAEAAFLTEEPADGDQFPFTRLRIRMDVPQPGVYTVTHPYGSEEFTVTAVGAGQEVRTSADIQFMPGPAGGTLQNQGCVAPWLQWDPTESAPPIGFIGDGGTPHTVTGSPTGNNFFQVSAVDLAGAPIDLDGSGGNTVSTDLFTVSGKLYDGALATPMISDRTTYERDAMATTGQVDVFATAAQTATLTFNGGPNLPAGDIPLSSDPLDTQVSGKFFASVGLTPDASVVPPLVELNATDSATDETRLLRLVTDLVTITRARYNLADSTLTIEAVSTDASLTPELTVAEYGLPLPAQIVTDAPPATVNVTSAVGGTAERRVEVVEVIDIIPPMAVDDPESTSVNTPVTFDVTSNDTDAGGSGIDPASVVITGGPANGTATNHFDGRITYEPGTDFVGSDSLTYTVQDNAGNLSNEATVNITVNPANANLAPTANPDTTFEVEEDSGLASHDVLFNDTDPENDDLTIIAVTHPVAGSGFVAFGNTSISFTPALNFNGLATFSYTISDGNDNMDTANVTVNVTPVNDNPLAVDDPDATTITGVPVTIDVLGNDTDVDGDDLVVVAVDTTGTIGAVTNDVNDVTYTSAVGFTGTDTFTYTVGDGNGGSDTATVTVNVSAVADPVVDLDITALRVSNRVNAGGIITLRLDVRLGGAVSGLRPATIVGVSPRGQIYEVTMNVNDEPGGGSTRFDFPTFATIGADRGVITWTATLADDDADVDLVTDTTRVR